ncbi:MAG TPA: isoamylase early set domain-containing protein, partial [Prolixibacteraceae bacterium]|nr:isoamylase early set domain-containing protein [Prolixibacteraceae bacterium]
MKKYWIILLLFSGISAGQNTINALFDPGKVCRIEDGQLIFTLNLRWGEKEKKELTGLFDLDSLLLAGVYRGETEITFRGENWKVKKAGSGMVELYKPLDGIADGGTGKPQLYDLMDQWMNFRGEIAEEQEVFGVNRFRLVNAFVYAGNLAQFYLPGFEKANRVYLAGSFNNWNTAATPMRFTGKGWITDLRLAPGKYTYKYVVDGRWTIDPSNQLTERGGAGTPNSVVFCPNHVFRLKGFQNAGKVVVTGNF